LQVGKNIQKQVGVETTKVILRAQSTTLPIITLLFGTLFAWSKNHRLAKEAATMRERERTLERKLLDFEMRSYTRAGMKKNPTSGLLRAVRQALRVPVAEIAGKMGVCRSVAFDLEAREPKNRISLRSMTRMAEAMGCKVVYGIVPKNGLTLEALAEERLWRGIRTTRD
jgi:hypothetical protein